MWTWIADNIVTVITLLAVLLIIAGAITVLIKDRKKGKSSCGGNCAHCPMGGSCCKK